MANRDEIKKDGMNSLLVLIFERKFLDRFLILESPYWLSLDAPPLSMQFPPDNTPYQYLPYMLYDSASLADNQPSSPPGLMVIRILFCFTSPS